MSNSRVEDDKLAEIYKEINNDLEEMELNLFLMSLENEAVKRIKERNEINF